jgi:hypothetical protein
VAIQAAEKGLFWIKGGKKHTSGAKARADSAAFVPGINPWPTARTSFSAASIATLAVLAIAMGWLELELFQSQRPPATVGNGTSPVF